MRKSLIIARLAGPVLSATGIGMFVNLPIAPGCFIAFKGSRA
ncbi:MAG TPA: hypothetical protein VH558_18740 [Pseudolabrys sp.]|jgi:hypothetical protein